jgi:hypothetical protein
VTPTRKDPMASKRPVVKPSVTYPKAKPTPIKDKPNVKVPLPKR